jgi:hypothetical protein
MSKAIQTNPYRQWLDGDRIEKRPRDMTDAELVKFTAAGAVVVVQRIKALRPYFQELNKRFKKLKRGETLCGFPNWDTYCTKHLGKTRRALNYMLIGGNTNRSTPSGNHKQLSDGNEDEGFHPTAKQSRAWEDVEIVLQLLAEASHILAKPISEGMAQELKKIIESAIQTATEAMSKLGVERDT